MICNGFGYDISTMHIMYLDHIYFLLSSPTPTDPLCSSQPGAFRTLFRVYHSLGEGLLTGIWLVYQRTHPCGGGRQKVSLSPPTMNCLMVDGALWAIPCSTIGCWWDQGCVGNQNCSRFECAMARSYPEDKTLQRCQLPLSLRKEMFLPIFYDIPSLTCDVLFRAEHSIAHSCFYRQARLRSWPQIKKAHQSFPSVVGRNYKLLRW